MALTSARLASAPFLMLELHYDNPNHLSGVVDSSGLRLQFTPWAGSGATQAGVVFAGAALPTVTVPPAQPAWAATTLSPVLNIPAGAAGSVFSVIHHMHQIGKAQWLEVVDSDGSNPEELACDTVYNFDLQEAKYLQTHFAITGGKRLKLTCVYDSTSRTQMTHGGDESNDEMCIIALMYYPYVATVPSLLTTASMGVATADQAGKVCGCIGAPPADPYDDAGAIPDAGASQGNLLLLHGVLMLIAWGLFLPLGAVFALCWRTSFGSSSRWFEAHRACQTLGAALALVSFFVAFAACQPGPHFDSSYSPHKLVGLFIVLLLAVQVGGGFLRPHAPGHPQAPEKKPTAARAGWLLSHRLLGVVTLFGAGYQVVTGSTLVQAYVTPSLGRSLYGVYGGMLALCLAVAAVGYTRRGRAEPLGKLISVESVELTAHPVVSIGAAKAEAQPVAL